MYNACMPGFIQVRNVPEEAAEKLKARAAAQNKSLNTYMLELIEREVETPSMAEVFARIRARGPLGDFRGGEAAEVIRAAREERDAQLQAAFDRNRRAQAESAP
jgi:plasmid stability protein